MLKHRLQAVISIKKIVRIAILSVLSPLSLPIDKFQPKKKKTAQNV